MISNLYGWILFMHKVSCLIEGAVSPGIAWINLDVIISLYLAVLSATNSWKVSLLRLALCRELCCCCENRAQLAFSKLGWFYIVLFLESASLLRGGDFRMNTKISTIFYAGSCSDSLQCVKIRGITKPLRLRASLIVAGPNSYNSPEYLKAYDRLWTAR